MEAKEPGEKIQGEQQIEAAKIRKQSTLEALKKAFFSKQGHKTNEPQLGRHRSAPPIRPNTLKKPKGPEEPERRKTQL